jgi:hypothetical protein
MEPATDHANRAHPRFLGLQFINDRVVRVLSGATARRRFIPMFAAVMRVTALLATMLHGIEVTIWALSPSRWFTRRQGCNAVFAQRNDQLRSREPLLGN